MKIVTSYKVNIVNEINKYGKICPINKKVIKDTIKIYRQAVSFYTKVINDEWNDISILEGKRKNNYIEKLTHKTDNNLYPKYDFDKKFYKFPSYFRRVAIQQALGIVSSFKANYSNWEEKGRKGNPPKLSLNHFSTPSFYKKNCYNKISDNLIELKVYKNNDWVFITYKLKGNDISYIKKHCIGKKESCPSISINHKTIKVNFSYEENVKLVDKKPLEYKVLGVDLGVNNQAVMCVMDKTGTVYNRKFIDFKYEKDQLYRTLNLIKGYQRKGLSTKYLWRRAKNYNSEISRKTAKAIIDFALQNNIDCIVFEYLDKKGKTKNEKIHYWKCKEIQSIVERKSHQNGLRVSHICAWNTSKLAFDGSGNVTRETYTIKGKVYHNYSICIFPTGKQYHCDLNASYNIASRFFLRAYDKKYHNIKTKTPQRTLNTLIDYLKSSI